MTVSVAIALVLAAGAPADARDCPSWFGDAAQFESNAAEAERKILEVIERRDSVDVTHTVGRWQSPTKVRLPGITVDAVVVGADETVAEVTIAGDDACAAGTYALRAGDSVGQRAHVLRVLKDVVLLEVDGKLAQVGVEGVRSRKLSLVWRSDYSLVVDASGKSLGGSSGGGRSGGKSTSKKPRASKKLDRNKNLAAPAPSLATAVNRKRAANKRK